MSGDPFGKKGDNDPVPDDLGYVDVAANFESPEYFGYYSDIPNEETQIDRIAAGFNETDISDLRNSRIVKALLRLKPGTATYAWNKLASKSASESDYAYALGDRLIVIACASTGGASVIRGLIRSQTLCPFGNKVASVVKTGLRADGTSCDNLQQLRTHANELAGCQINGR